MFLRCQYRVKPTIDAEIKLVQNKKMSEKPVQSEEVIQDVDGDSTLERLESFFSELAPGYKIAVYRTKPREFYGLLEEIDVTDGHEPIDLMYLLKTWGGRELRLKVRNARGQWVKTLTVPLFSYPPLVFGRPAVGDRFSGSGGYDGVIPPGFAPAPAAPAPAAPAPAAGPADNLAELLGVLQKFRTSDTELLTSLLQRSLIGQAPAPRVSPYHGINEALDLITRVQAITGGAGLGAPAAPSSDPDNILPTITRLVEALITRDREKPVMARPALSGVKSIAPRIVPPIVQPAPVAPLPQTPIGEGLPLGLDGAEIVTAIAGADPIAVARIYGEAMRSMSAEQRSAAVEAFDAMFEQEAPEAFDDDETVESEKHG